MTGHHRRQIRALAHRLQTESALDVLSVRGVDGGGDTLAMIERILEKNELVKLRLRDATSKKEVKLVAASLATACKAHVAQVIGHTALLYRRRSLGPPLITFDEAGQVSYGAVATSSEETTEDG